MLKILRLYATCFCFPAIISFLKKIKIPLVFIAEVECWKGQPFILSWKK